jgi:ATP-dependent RNA helicase MSS116
MEIGSVRPSEVVAMDTSHKCTEEVHPQFADPSFMTPYKFVDQPPASIHPQTLEAITNVMKLERLTEVQHKTLQQSCIASNRNGSVVVNDVLGRARTGTGKTVAFLMPAIHTVLSNTTNIKQSIQVLVISPTRELDTQITTQAQQRLTSNKQLSVQIIMGGTNMKTDISKFSNKLPIILVATPGRMKDHLENTTLKNGTKFGANCLSELKVLLDEADQLLEMGSRQNTFKIVSFLPPPESRQTLLISATMPKDLREVVARAMKPSSVTVDCIHDYENDNNDVETNAHVEQTHVILPPRMDRLLVSVLEVTLQAMKQQE